MDDLIEALIIFRKYLSNTNRLCPLHCEHDELTVCDVHASDVSMADGQRLSELGFFADDDDDCFKSYRFGSC